VATAACTVTTGDFDGNGSLDLRVVTDGANQTLRIVDDPRLHSTTVFLDCNGDGDFIDAGDRNGEVFGEFELFDLRLSGGDDTVIIEVPETLPPDVTAYDKQNRNFAVQLGAGNNVFRFLHPWTDSPPVVPPFTARSSRLTIDVQAGAGADDVRFQFGGAHSSLIVLRTDLGGGNDTVTLGTFDIARYEQASVVNVDFQTDAGSDTVIFQPNADLFDGSVYRVNIGTGPGADTVEGGILSFIDDGRLIVSVDLGPGNDALSWRPPALVGADGSVHVSVAGGPGQDDVAFALADDPLITSDFHGRVDLFVQGDDGNDSLSVHMSPPAPGSSDLTGTVRVHVDGGAGNDTVLVSQRNNAGSTGTLDFLVRGGLGTDRLGLSVGGPAIYAPVSQPLLDGGPGTDECVLVGPGTQKQNCEF
jgi:hypothetical protein